MNGDVRAERHALLELDALLARIEALAADSDRRRFEADDNLRWVCRFGIFDLRSALPGIGDGTIRNALDDLRRDGRVDVDGPELLRKLRRGSAQSNVTPNWGSRSVGGAPPR